MFVNFVLFPTILSNYWGIYFCTKSSSLSILCQLYVNITWHGIWQGINLKSVIYVLIYSSILFHRAHNFCLAPLHNLQDFTVIYFRSSAMDILQNVLKLYLNSNYNNFTELKLTQKLIKANVFKDHPQVSRISKNDNNLGIFLYWHIH